jgi:hypothetical protein
MRQLFGPWKGRKPKTWFQGLKISISRESNREVVPWVCGESKEDLGAR